MRAESISNDLVLRGVMALVDLPANQRLEALGDGDIHRASLL
jgi:hypothetical protein